MLSDAEVVIVGTGLMGTSLALALRGKVRIIIGVDANPATLETAAPHFDVISTDLSAAATADLIILATPVQTILALLKQLTPLAKPGALLLDLGSAKQEIVAMMNALPDHLSALGGHPMCGKEKSGPEAADAALYQGCKFVLCPTLHTTPQALVLAEQLIAAIGAQPVIADAQQHDEAVAAISHLPYMISVGLVETVLQFSRTKDDDLAWQLAASGFRDTSRLAASDVTMMVDTLLANREAVLRTISAFQSRLDTLQEALRLAPDSAFPELRDTLERAQQARRDWPKTQE